jgi:hypothetical protein
MALTWSKLPMFGECAVPGEPDFEYPIRTEIVNFVSFFLDMLRNAGIHIEHGLSLE